MAAERRRPMTKQEYRQMKKAKEKLRRQMEREAWEAARGPMDMPFFLLAMILLTIGMIMLLSASFPSAQASKDANYNPLYYFQRQAMWAGLGLFAMFWVSKINYHRFEGMAKLGIYISVILLVLVILPGPKENGKLLGISHNGATRWLGIPGMGTMQFQPSEVAKVGLIVFFAQSISKKREKMKTLREGFLYHVVILILMCLLTVIEPHFSGAILIFGIGAAMMVVGGIHWGWIAAGITGVLGAGYLVLFTDLMQKIGYNAARITVWRDPFGGDLEFQRRYAWQTIQSLITIGSGGLLGVGLG